MRTYTIPIYRTYRSEITVDAESIHEAITKMEKMIDNGDLPEEQPGELDSIEMDHDADPSTIIEEENPQYIDEIMCDTVEEWNHYVGKPLLVAYSGVSGFYKVVPTREVNKLLVLIPSHIRQGSSMVPCEGHYGHKLILQENADSSVSLFCETCKKELGRRS